MQTHLPTPAQPSLLTNVRNERGMTLIEIMIVIAIIAGLMAVLGTSAVSYLNSSKVSTAKIHMKEISKALENYNMACNSYPTTEQGMKALTTSPGESCPSWGPEPYLKKEPKDPWGRPYVYDSTDGTAFELKTLGRDKKDGGAGYDKDITSAELD